jgi:MoaA/NifB/PqqE/SkfB family radical SAM enzyme
MKQVYTSTGNKIIHHPEVIKKVAKKRGAPVSLQVGPTSRCNLNCSFCSNAKRKSHEDLDVNQLIDVMIKLKALGLKTVEITGGGDPTMYDDINFLMESAHAIGLEQGMITNGILLKRKINSSNLNNLTWLRVSMNCLDYFSHVDIPKIKGTLGFSYVMNDKTDEFVLKRLDDMVKKYQPRYVRIVPNCLATYEQQEENNRKYGEQIKDWGSPYFYQEKVFSRPENCYWCYFKPFILHDGYVYPCSSVVLHSGAEGKFHEKFRWVKMEGLAGVYQKDMVPFATKDCDHCVFKTQNDLIAMLLNPQMENFI